jgi:ABC-2 type transport system permease protein
MVPEDVNTLVVAGVRQLSQWDQFAIDQFLMRGGRLFFMIDRVEIPEGTLYAIEAETGVDSLLQTYGVIVKPDLVVDRVAASATFSAGMFRYTLPYPLWPLVTKDGFSTESPITNQLERAVFPWTGSIRLIDRGETGPEATVLAKSSPQSWSEEDRLDLNPQRSFAPQTEVAPRNLAVLLDGSFESHFRDRAVPTIEGAEVWQGPKLDRSPETQIVVISNSRMVRSDFLGNYPENRIFFLNAIDWLTLGDSLIGIRSRAVTSRPLKEIGEKSKASMRFAATFGVPIALIVWGLSRRYLRSSRQRDRLQYLR